MSKMKYQYFKVRKDRQEYLGNRYFRIDFDSESPVILQICFNVGATKKGKGNNMGIYLIHKLTFFANYLAQSYCIPCTKAEFEKQRELVNKILK